MQLTQGELALSVSLKLKLLDISRQFYKIDKPSYFRPLSWIRPPLGPGEDQPYLCHCVRKGMVHGHHRIVTAAASVIAVVLT